MSASHHSSRSSTSGIEGQVPSFLRPLFDALAIDFRPNPRPATWRFILASVVAIIGSVAVDAIIVAIAKSVFPTLSNYAHFQPGDYVKLTVIGVIGACIGWPIVAAVSSRPTRLFAIAAVVVTLVLLLPDLYIAIQGQPAKAVFVLVCMHLAIAVVTYFSLVLIAPVRDTSHRRRSRHR